MENRLVLSFNLKWASLLVMANYVDYNLRDHKEIQDRGLLTKIANYSGD